MFPPDRLSADPTSEYFNPMYKKVGMRFDGRVIFNCMEYCVSEGWVKLGIDDGRGGFKRERGRFITVKKTGLVEPYER